MLTRTVVLTAALGVAALAAPPTIDAAPNFPLTFAGEKCDLAGSCTPTLWTLDRNGVITENYGLSGYYAWDKTTRTFTANYIDFVGTSMVGTKDDGIPCIRGDWTTTTPDLGGTFWFCKI